MAIYYNMCVDCGADTALADLLESHFRDYVLQFDDRDSVRCKALRIMERGIEFAGVEPIGMGSGTLPAELRRSDLVAPDIVQTIRTNLYRELEQFNGFRRAMFGAECWDQLVICADDDMDIGYGWMISSIDHFPNAPDDCKIERYNNAYRIVLGETPAT